MAPRDPHDAGDAHIPKNARILGCTCKFWGVRSPRRGGSLVALVAWLSLGAPALSGCATLSPIERAEAHVRKNENDQAIATLRSHLTLHPEDSTARSLLIRVLALTGRIDLAKLECDRLARIMPGSPRPAIELGHAYELVHDYEHAIAAYDEATEQAPASPDGPRIGGLRAARWGEVEVAVPRLEEAVRRGATDAELLHALGLAYVHLRRLEDAEATYRSSLRLHPEALESLLGLATVALVRKDYAAALNAYDRLVAARPRSTQASLGRAYALAKLGRRDDAWAELARAESLGAPAPNIARQRAALGPR